MVGEAGVDGIGCRHRRAGQAEVLAEPPRCVGEKPGAADIRHEADAGLGHREARALGHDADRRVPRQPDAAAHRDAVGEHDDRLRVFGHARVERRTPRGRSRRSPRPRPTGSARTGRARRRPRRIPARRRRRAARAARRDVVLPRVERRGRSRIIPRSSALMARGRSRVRRPRPPAGAHAPWYSWCASRLSRRNVTAHSRRPCRGPRLNGLEAPVSCGEESDFPPRWGELPTTRRGFGMPDGQVLEFSGVTKRFGPVPPSRTSPHASSPGVVTGFLGPNGAGKTTSLRILLGLVRATEGTATIGGLPYATAGASAADRRRRARGLELPPRPHGREPPQGLRAGRGSAPVARRRGHRHSSGSRTSPAARSAGSRSGCGSGWDSPTRCSATPAYWCSTSRPTGSIPKASSGCAGSCASSPARAARCSCRRTCSSEVPQTVDSLLIIAQGRLVFQGALDELSDQTEHAVVVDAPDRAALARCAPRRRRVRSRCSGRASPCGGRPARDRRHRRGGRHRALLAPAARSGARGGLPRSRQRRARAPERGLPGSPRCRSRPLPALDIADAAPVRSP